MAAQCATVMLRREVGNCDARRCSRQGNCAGKAHYNNSSRRAKTAVCGNTFSLPLWVAQMRRSSLAAQGLQHSPRLPSVPGFHGWKFAPNRVRFIACNDSLMRFVCARTLVFGCLAVGLQMCGGFFYWPGFGCTVCVKV